MIGILSDAHGHYHALAKAVNVLVHQGAERIIFLGDALGYIPSVKTLSFLRSVENLEFYIKGNHEEMIISSFDDASKMKIYKTAEIRSQLDAGKKHFLASLPVRKEVKFPCGEVLFVHGSPSNPLYGYVYPDTPLDEWADLKYSHVFSGHTHYPFIRENNGSKFVNVGSCGLPRDHGKLGSAVLFNEENGECKILRFSIEKETQRLCREITNMHASVYNLFKRESSAVVGEFINE